MKVKVLVSFNMKLPTGKLIRVDYKEIISESDTDLVSQCDEIKKMYEQKYSNRVFCSYEKFSPVEDDTEELTTQEDTLILENTDSEEEPTSIKKTKTQRQK